MNTEPTFHQSIPFLALITGAILLLPFIGMQFSDEVNWTLSDFVFAGVMIFGTGLFYKFITRKSQDMLYRVAIGFALLTGFILIWVNMAVGIVGSEDNPANLMYFAVIAVGLIGALLARFESNKMASVMFVMTGAQGIVAVIILTLGLYQTPPSSVVHIISVSGFFMVLFIVSGFFFRYAIQEKKHTDTTIETINSAS
jgi:predicted membrane channel-forming protein YqfA (hemolysin III family)